MKLKETLEEFKERTKTMKFSQSSSDSPICKKQKLDLDSTSENLSVLQETEIKLQIRRKQASQFPKDENIVAYSKSLSTSADTNVAKSTWFKQLDSGEENVQYLTVENLGEIGDMECDLNVKRMELNIHPCTRNTEWENLNNHHVISMPDKWEFPWYAAWDLAFHMIPFCRIDPEFSKSQLLLFLSEDFLHPSGKIPAYEFNFSDINPPVHAWGCWEVYVRTGRQDLDFLRKCFHKLLINYTWWFNERRSETEYLFGGGFLGLDNISVIDRSSGVPIGWYLHQADGTGWVAFYSLTMLKISIELAKFDPVYADLIPRFLGNFLRICKDLNKTVEDGGLWDEDTGFYYDVLRSPAEFKVLEVRSLVGIIPLTACCVFNVSDLAKVKGQNVLELFKNMIEENEDYIQIEGAQVFLTSVRVDRIQKILSYLGNSEEFLSPFGIRSLSKVYEKTPYILEVDKQFYEMEFCAGESNSQMFGGNSNWRGPIYFSVNYLILETLTTIHSYYGDENIYVNGRSLAAFVTDIRRRLVSIFLPNEKGRRPCHGENKQYSRLEGWKDTVLFYEYFHSETGRGCGARNQTGWTALIIELIIDSHGL